MPVTLVNTINPTLIPNDHPYMSGPWTPNYQEFNATGMEVIGEIPADIDGVYIRNTENPIHEPIGRYHPFEGDGMIHAISFADGQAEYRNRFVRTKAFFAEQESGRSLWAGLLEHPGRSMRPGWGAHGSLKDASSTDVIVHAGRILSTYYQCGEGYRLDPYTLEQFGIEGWVPLDGISAHPKLDEQSGELLFFNYSKYEPYLHYGVVGPDNRMKHYVPVPVPGPRLPHDMSFSENYSVLNDLPVFWDPELLQRGIHATRFFPEIPSRFAVLPRFGRPGDVRWFEAEPTYVLHFLNAYEEGDEVIMDGYFQLDPVPGPHPDAPPGLERMMAFLDNHLLKPMLHRWRFNLKTGVTVEQHLDDKILEFGTINQRYAGRKHRYVYSAVSKPGWFLFSGLCKHDLETGASHAIEFGTERYGSEPGFAPRIGARAEDDGYVVTFVTDMIENRSECLVLDAADIGAGPVCRVILPHRISSGTHATWAHGEDIRAARARA
jgi:carotenoid cleavage dioxygenase